jgi:hypothetical protein
MSTLQNRGQWPKGTSGNPKGRPRGVSYKMTKALLARVVNENGPLAEMLAMQMVVRMLKGDLRVLKMVLEHEAAAERAAERERARRGR